jgi:aspartate/methionine/tyrosine aminotransferase
MLRRAGVVPVPVRLLPPDWALPCDQIERAITRRCRAILLNNPMNPNGKLFDDGELAFLAGVLEQRGLIAICDEVYEHLTFDGRRHRPLMSFPEARSRCLRIGSAGKTFSITGWKVGYVTGPAPLLQAVAKAHQYLTFSTPPALQVGVAHGLGLPDAYFARLQTVLEERRDFLAGRLRQAGFSVLPCAGTYFLCVDIEGLDEQNDDVAFCHRLVAEAGVAAVPVSSFYAGRDMRRLIRLCFAKPVEKLAQAADRLAEWRRSQARAEEGSWA